MIDLTSSLTDQIAALARRDVSARELLEAHLARVEALDGPINSVITLAVERAADEATTIDRRRAAGEQLGPLAGVPTTIKDALATEGIRSTGGATELGDHVPSEDATAVRTVRDAGAVVFGKTNLPRWSGDVQSYNDMFGTTNNPWNFDRTPGGSSGGAAAAVAMGFSPMEIGTDIGGSVRIPASSCGIYGHKPSFGVIPTYGYLDHVRHHRNVADVNVFGPFARTIDDLEQLFGLLAGPNPDDSPGWRLELPPSRATELGDFRVAAWVDDAVTPLDGEVRAVLEDALSRLEAAGARIDHDRRPDLDPVAEAARGMGLISAATNISDIADAPDPDEPPAPPSYVQWDLMHRRRGRARQRWAEFFEHVDVLLCPVQPVPPIRHLHDPAGSNWRNSVLADHDGRPYLDLALWTSFIGSAYLPVTVPPAGRTDGGLPIGLQVVAPYLHDRTALAFARAIEPVLGGYEPPPPAAGPIAPGAATI